MRETPPGHCETCGRPLSNATLAAKCPRCLLVMGLEPAGHDSDVAEITSEGEAQGPDGERGAEGPPSMPTVIGRYRILRLIGEGGMGMVFEAEQQQPRRIVALKVIKPGLDTPNLLRRFDREGEALGRLQHPGIAQIYEAGVADTGFGPQPYFAMELIRGETLHEYADKRQLDIRGRMEIVARIAEAVHHAHHRGLIHRDLKPGNILVDETGQPKILDFGIARITDSEDRVTLRTGVGQLVGTPAYMSPEQVLGDPHAIDARSDVYALGVILFELLVSKLPYAADGNLHEILRSIVEEEPARLSSFDRRCQGDIETIVGKALEKDKGRRYASAADFAADIRRYLNDEPIVARPPSAIYTVRKFARRHTALATGIVAVFVVLTCAIVVVTFYAVSARRDRDRAVQAELSAGVERDRAADNEKLANSLRVRAENTMIQAQSAEAQARIERDVAVAERRRADREADIARAVLDFLGNDLLRMANPILRPRSLDGRASSVTKPDITIKELLDRASERIPGRFDDKPMVEIAIRETIAETYYGIGEYNAAQEHFRRAIALRTREQGPGAVETLRASVRLGATLHQSRQFPEAETVLKQVVERPPRVGTDHSPTEAAIRELADLYRNPRNMANRESQAAIDLLRRVVDSHRRALGDEHPTTHLAISALMSVFRWQGPIRNAEATAFLTELLEDRRRAAVSKGRTTATDMSELLNSYMSPLQVGSGDAEEILKSSLEDSRRRLGSANPETLAAVQALVRFYTTRTPPAHGKAEAVLLPVVEKQRIELGNDHRATIFCTNLLVRVLIESPQPKYEEAESFLIGVRGGRGGQAAPRRALHNGSNQLAGVYIRQRRVPEAEALLTPIVLSNAPVGDRDNLLADRQVAMESMALLSHVYRRQGKSEQADAVTKQFWTAAETFTESSFRHTASGEDLFFALVTLGTLAVDFADQGRLAEADKLAASVLEGYRKGARTVPGVRNIADLVRTLARAFTEQGQEGKTEQLLHTLLNVQRTELGDRDTTTMDTMGVLSLFFARRRRFAEARDLDMALVDLNRAVFGPAHPSTLDRMTVVWVRYATEIRYHKSQGQMELARRTAAESLPFLNEFLEWPRNASGGAAGQDGLLLLNSITAVHAHMGNYAEAEGVWRSIQDQMRKNGSPAINIARMMPVIGWLHFLQGKYESAEAVFREYCGLLPTETRQLNCQSMLGATLAAQKRFVEAERLLLDSYERTYERVPPLRTDFPPAFSEADILVETQPGERILRLYEHWDKPDKVAEWKKKLQNRPTDTPRP